MRYVTILRGDYWIVERRILYSGCLYQKNRSIFVGDWAINPAGCYDSAIRVRNIIYRNTERTVHWSWTSLFWTAGWKRKWNEWCFRKCGLNWARNTSWGWWDEWDDTALQTQNSSPGGLKPSTLPLGHGGSPIYRIFTIDRGRNILFLWNLNVTAGFEPAISDIPSRQH